MSIPHSSIQEPDIHEVKGAAAALNKTVLTSNGDGTTSFYKVNYSDLIGAPTSGLAQVVTGYSTSTSQLPTAVSTPLQITFGAGSTATDASIASDGSITFNKTGIFQVKLHLNFGRTSGTGVAVLTYRALINGAQVGQTFGVTLDDNGSLIQVMNSFVIAATASNVLTFEVARDSAGINNGGLYKTPATTSGWADIPSSSVTVYE